MSNRPVSVELLESTPAVSGRRSAGEHLIAAGFLGVLSIAPMAFLLNALDLKGTVLAVILTLGPMTLGLGAIPLGLHLLDANEKARPKLFVPSSCAELLELVRDELDSLGELGELGLPEEFAEVATALSRSVDSTTRAISETVTPALTAMRLGVVTASQLEALDVFEELLERDLANLERLNSTAREYLAVLLEDGHGTSLGSDPLELDREGRLDALAASTQALKELRVVIA